MSNLIEQDEQTVQTINSAMNAIFDIFGVHNKEDYDNILRSGLGGHEKIYNLIKIIAPNHWNSLANPKASVRASLQQKLPGYLNYNN